MAFDFPSPAECDSISAIPDVAIRNLNITQGYFEISRAFANRIAKQSNWCTFGVWASKQAGQSIRHEDLMRTALRDFGGPEALPLKKLLGFDCLNRALGQLAPFKRSGDFVAIGNNKVFMDICREFSRFLTEFIDEKVPNAAHLDQFSATLKPGPPPDGQDFLRLALRSYYRAWFTTDDHERAECMFYGNLLVGYHEQIRLQPQIEGAMNAAVIDPDELCRCVPAVPAPLRGALKLFCSDLARHVRKVITHTMMTITFPGPELLHLGTDLRGSFAASLSQLTNPDLLALLKKVDPTPDSLAGSGAVDWADFPDRIHFIADLFRAYHQAEKLLAAPYTDDKVNILKSGRLPIGPL